MKIQQAVIETPAEGEEQLVATMKSAGADQKRIDAAVALYRVQKGFADIVTEDDAELVAKSAGYSKKAKSAKKDDEDDDDDMPSKKTKKSAEVQAADLAKLDPEMRTRVEAVFKSNENLVSQVGQLTTTLKGLIDQSSARELTAKAEKEFSHIPGKAEELGLMLKSAHDASPELGKSLEKMLGTINGLVAKSSMLHTVGTAGGAAPGGDAWSRIEQLATNLTMKSANGGEMSKDQRIDYVVTKTAEGKKLYRDYLSENPAQRAKHGF